MELHMYSQPPKKYSTSHLASVNYTHVDVSVSLLMFCINFVHVEVCACVYVCVHVIKA